MAWPSSSKLDRGGWDWEEDEEKRKSEVEHLAKPLFTSDQTLFSTVPDKNK